MKLHSRLAAPLGIAACFLGLAAAVPLIAFAQQDFPTHPIHLVIPWPPGGPVDIVGRALGRQMSEALGQPVVIDNRAGATGLIGTAYVAKAAPDGYTLVVTGIGPNAVGPALIKDMPYDVAKDFTQISIVATVPNVLVVNADLPVKTVAELIAYAHANPGKLSYGSTGTGATPHLAAELFKSMAKVDMVHVPYKGAAPAVVDLLGGQIQLMFAPIATALPHIKSGKLRALGVTTLRRSSVMPDVPTIAESGLPGYDQTVWNGLAGPANMSPAVVAKLHAAVVKAVGSQELRAIFTSVGSDALSDTPAEFTALVAEEIIRWAKLVRDVGLKPE
jgi:tripartite-type tricarboxylate transporter receptor subunit TctC